MRTGALARLSFQRSDIIKSSGADDLGPREDSSRFLQLVLHLARPLPLRLLMSWSCVLNHHLEKALITAPTELEWLLSCQISELLCDLYSIRRRRLRVSGEKNTPISLPISISKIESDAADLHLYWLRGRKRNGKETEVERQREKEL